MCGIVAYLGKKDQGVQIVLEGLKRLEYRGYDSAGICLKNLAGDLENYKKVGRIEVLKDVICGKDIKSHSCIGHTRWATHGKVTDQNAHPHVNTQEMYDFASDEKFTVGIVHNGIIENAAFLKKRLIQEGVNFQTQTDTEVFLGLILLELQKGLSFREAFIESFKHVEGNSAFVAQMKGVDEILSIKRSAPLVCGIDYSSSSAYASSDPYALAGMVDDLFFPDDEILCVLSLNAKHPLEFFDLELKPAKRYLKKAQDLSPEEMGKGHFEHYMLKEIYEQPGLIRFFWQYYFEGEGKEVLENISKLQTDCFHIVACGTAWHAGLVLKNIIEHENQISCHVEYASEFRYRDPLLLKGATGLFISQSGETADTLAAQSLCKQRKIPTVSIVNVEGSTLFRNSDYNLLTKAGLEIGVASTKAFTQQVLAGILLSQVLGAAFKDPKKREELKKEFDLLARRIDELLADTSWIREVAEKIYHFKGFIYTARGQYFPIALEGALKLKEIAYVHAEGYASGELKHGPIALIDEEMVNVAIVGPKLYEKTVSNIEEVKARKGLIVVIGPEKDAHLQDISDYYIELNFSGLDRLAPLLVNVVAQLLAYYMAKFKGTDIDKPRNLAKSVTVE